MLRLPAGAEYGLLAMVHLAREYPSGELAKASSIAAEQEVPHAFLERLLAQLRAAGLVESHRGPGGGHRLTRPPEQTTAYEVLEALTGQSSGPTTGRLDALWERCRSALRDALGMSLAELADEISRSDDVATYQI